MRPGRFLTESLNLVLLVVAVTAFEPEPLAGLVVSAFPSEQMRRDLVEEPPVVADDDRAAWELLQGVFERTQRLDVEVVGRLVEKQHVSAGLQRQRKVEPVALATGEHACRLLLVRALETEGRDIRAAVYLHLADLDEVEAVGDDLPQRLLRVQTCAGLVDV